MKLYIYKQNEAVSETRRKATRGVMRVFTLRRDAPKCQRPNEINYRNR